MTGSCRLEAVIDHELLLSSPYELEETVQSPYFDPRNCKQAVDICPRRTVLPNLDQVASPNEADYNRRFGGGFNRRKEACTSEELLR